MTATGIARSAENENRFLDRNRKFVPLAATFLLFVAIYVGGIALFGQMRAMQPFFNLFDAAPFRIVVVVGEAFVIISGGIDLSVSGILALSTVVAVSLINEGFNPWMAFAIVLLMGTIFGLVQGLLITYLKVQPFIATLAGMWLGRGLAYLISDQEVRISDSTYKTLQGTKILIPILSDLSGGERFTRTPYITYLVVIALAVFIVGLLILHLTRFGRTVYAMGGMNGANEVSARLMGLPVDRTKVAVYTLSGFCAALGGILFSIYVNSGHGSYGGMFELTVIAAVVIGGVALTGGEGYMIGALIGVMLTSLIQSLIQYQGQLLSYWTYIFIGALMLLFLFIQSLVATWNEAAIARSRTGVLRRKPVIWYQTKPVKYGGVAALIVVLLAAVGFVAAPFVFPKQSTLTCELQPMRTTQVQALVASEAVIVYERNGGTSCIDVIWAVYPDGRVTADWGNGKVKSSQVTMAQLEATLVAIEGEGWFTTQFFDSHHTPCAACYQYSITIKYKDQTRTIGAVDGGTDAPAHYWNVTTDLAGILPTSSE